MWDLPVTNASETDTQIHFYVMSGDGFILLRNEILQCSYQLGPHDLLVIPKGVRAFSSKILIFKKYAELPTSDDPDAVRTSLFILPSKMSSFAKVLLSEVSYAFRIPPAATINERFRYGRVARRIANKLYEYTYFSLHEIALLCYRGGVMTPVLKQELQKALQNCRSCEEVGRPLQSRKIF